MDFKYKFLPSDPETSSSSNDDDDDSLSLRRLLAPIRIPSRFLSLGTVMLPFGAFIFCVIHALHSNYKATTLVFCGDGHAFNYLPSLSAAIGDFSFSKSIWIFCVTLHAPPRFLYAYMYLQYLKTIIHKRYMFWVNLAFFLNVIENISLLGLSYISSKASLPLHALNFVMFLLSSGFYMIIMCILLHRCRNIPCATALEAHSQKVKKILLYIILTAGCGLPYFYIRHNSYCEPGVYTMFALLEYVIVICNMAFHVTAYWDFYDVTFKLPLRKWGSSNGRRQAYFL